MNHNFKILLIPLITFLGITLGLAQTVDPSNQTTKEQTVTQKTNDQKQSITGVMAYISLSDENRAFVRIGVNPESLNTSNKSPADIMKEITVIVCAHGECHFAQALPNLGFYQTMFDLGKPIEKNQLLTLLVVACSHLGCTKSEFTTPICKGAC